MKTIIDNTFAETHNKYGNRMLEIENKVDKTWEREQQMEKEIQKRIERWDAEEEEKKIPVEKKTYRPVVVQ